MYKILIVDDEDIVKQGLKKIILNMNLRIAEIFESSDGKEALQMIHANRPDIIITDIKMPNMDGLELVEAVRNFDKHCKFIVLSGYGDFSFAQKAIKYGVTDYLLKPFKREKLFDILNEIILVLDDESKVQIRNNNYHKTLNLLQQKVIKEVLQNEYKAFDIAKTLASVEIDFNQSGFIVIEIYMGNVKSNIDEQTIMESLFFYKKNLDLSIYSFSNKYGHIMFLINIEQCAAQDFFENIIKCSFKSKIFVGISLWSTDVESLPALAQQAQNALNYRLFNRASSIVKFSDYSNKSSLLQIPVAYYDAISNAMIQSKQTELNKAINKLFDRILLNEEINPESVINTLKNMIVHIARYVSDSYNLYHYCKDYIDNIDDLYQMSDSLFDFKEKIKDMLFEIMKNTVSNDEHIINSVISHAIRYMEINFNKDISLDVVSNEVSMNSNYFSSLFKKKTGYTFVKYLQKLRVEEAKRLLANPLKRIYEIAAETGFDNDKYFCKVFKELTGLTPIEYREKRNLVKL